MCVTTKSRRPCASDVGLWPTRDSSLRRAVCIIVEIGACLLPLLRLCDSWHSAFVKLSNFSCLSALLLCLEPLAKPEVIDQLTFCSYSVSTGAAREPAKLRGLVGELDLFSYMSLLALDLCGAPPSTQHQGGGSGAELAPCAVEPSGRHLQVDIIGCLSFRLLTCTTPCH